jgi:thymidine phosphorylase
MEQPLGTAIGNVLELREALAVLKGQALGKQSADLWALSLALGSEMLIGAGIAHDQESARKTLIDAVESGAALRTFLAFVEALGGDARVIDDPSLLVQASYREPIKATESGWVAEIAAEQLGWVAMALGAGRERKEQQIDPSVGLELWAKVGDRVEAGQPIALIHARSQSDWTQAASGVLAAYRFSAQPISSPPLIKGRVTIETLG